MADSKLFLFSKTIFGSLIAALPAIQEGLQTIATDPTIAAVIPPQFYPFVSLAGAAIAIIGRLTATQKVVIRKAK